MAFICVCDNESCKVEQKAARPGKYHLLPEGWYQSQDGGKMVCSIVCLREIQKLLPDVSWTFVRRERAPVGEAKCRWCFKLKKTCPAHSNSRRVKVS